MPYCLTLIVPFFQNIDTISTALNSITDAMRGADAKSIEIIFVNNNSSDGTEKVVKDYVSVTPGSFLIHEGRQGVSYARNAGINASSAEYIAFLDADDAIDPDYFHCVATALSFDPDIVLVKHSDFSEAQEYSVLSISEMLGGFLNGWWNFQFVFKKNLSLGLSFEGKCFEDFGYFPLILARAKKAVLIRQGLYRYRDNPNSLTKGSINWRILELQAQFDRLRLCSEDLGVGVYKRVRRDFYEHISLLRAIAGHFPVLSMTESLALFKLSDSWRGTLAFFIRVLKLNCSSLSRLFRRLVMKVSGIR